MRGFCDYPGCKDVATSRPTILVHTHRRPEMPLAGGCVFFQAFVGEDRHCIEYNCVGVDLCYHHHGTFNLKSYMTEATWSAIENQIDQLGLARPSKDSVTVQWEHACGANGLLVA